MRCHHKASPKYDYQCTLEAGHKGRHSYNIKGNDVQIYGCCPDGQIEKHESKD